MRDPTTRFRIPSGHSLGRNSCSVDIWSFSFLLFLYLLIYLLPNGQFEIFNVFLLPCFSLPRLRGREGWRLDYDFRFSGQLSLLSRLIDTSSICQNGKSENRGVLNRDCWRINSDAKEAKTASGGRSGTVWRVKKRKLGGPQGDFRRILNVWV